MLLKELNLEDKDNIIALALFGSYNTEQWIRNKYDNIHLTFVYLNEFDSNFANCYINSKDKVIYDPNKEIDFRLYVNKYLRNNEWLDSLIKSDTELLRRYATYRR